jgi:hypothetical protein
LGLHSALYACPPRERLLDGKEEDKIEGGVVTEFRIVTDHVTDIAPIRVFNSLPVRA